MKTTITLAAMILAGCAYTGAPTSISPDSQVGGTGDMGYTHEDLGGRKHLITITAKPGIMETEGSVSQRIHVFSIKFAAKTCPGAFDFVNDQNLTQESAGGFMTRARSYVFTCQA
jgi:hypothetical protein